MIIKILYHIYIAITINTNIKIPGEIIVHHYLKGTEEKLSEDETITDLIGNSYTTKQKEIEGYSLVSKPTTEELIFKDEVQEVVYEYEKIKVILDGSEENNKEQETTL